MNIRVIFSLCCYAFVFLFSMSLTSAVSIDVDDINSTFSVVSISDADTMYAYEINFDYTDSISSIDSANFLGAGASYGWTTRNSILKVYGSRLDSSQTGVSGSGYLFNITHQGSLDLRYTILVDSEGDETVEYFNSSGSSDSGGSSGGSSGGGGSGGSAVTSTLPDVIISPLEGSITTAPNRLARYNVTFINRESNPVTISLSSEGFNNSLTIPSSITVSADSTYVLTLIFEPIQRGLVTGTVFFDSNGQRINSLALVLNVRPENFLFDSTISLANRFRVIRPGENLHAQINLLQVGRPEDKIDVVANYIVKDFSGRSYLEDTETFFVEGQKEYNREFATQDLPEGKYILGLEIVYANAFATSSVQFEVRNSQVTREWFLAGFFIALLVLVGGVLFWAIHRRTRIYKPIASKGGRI